MEQLNVKSHEGEDISLPSQGDENGNLGIFYTREDVAQILTDWAILDKDATLLDPSYGGCAFLNAALATLYRRGNPQPGGQIYGVDIDPKAKSYLKDLFPAGAKSEQYVTGDFFDIDANHFGFLFSSLVGNPPYVRYHDIPERLQKRAEERMKELGTQISGRSSYWAFFLIYSIQFLRPGGRLAMVLPGALLHTDYAVKVREIFTSHFEEVSIFLLQERIFDKTEEESVVVCAGGAGKPNKTIRVGTVSTVDDLRTALDHPEIWTRTLDGEQGDGGWLRALVDQNVLDFYDGVCDSSSVIRLGDWVTPRIGVVTGNNRFFILSQSEREKREIPEEFFVPVIKRPVYLSGLIARNSNFRWLKEKDKEYLLLSLPESMSEMPGALRSYIEQGINNEVHQAEKCKSRKPWYVVPQNYVPDAFMPCMSAAWPRLIVNRSTFTCTNNIIRLSWKEERPAKDWLKLALGSLSTLTQLSAELVGRSYGGGVLKVEPTELSHLAIPLLPDVIVDQLAEKVNESLRGGNMAAATDAVDEALMTVGTSNSSVRLQQLRSARNKLFLRRRQHRRDATKIVK